MPIMCSSLVVPIMCSSLVADRSAVIVCLILHSSSCSLVFFICFHKLLSIYNLNKGYGPVTLLCSLRCLEYLLFGHLRFPIFGGLSLSIASIVVAVYCVVRAKTVGSSHC